MNRWTRRRRRRGSSAGTGPPSTVASYRLWRGFLSEHTTPMPSSERTWPAESTSLRPECRYAQTHHQHITMLKTLFIQFVPPVWCFILYFIWIKGWCSCYDIINQKICFKQTLYCKNCIAVILKMLFKLKFLAIQQAIPFCQKVTKPFI